MTEIITCFSRRQVFGYAFMVYALVAIPFIGFFVWGHHMLVSGQSPYASLIFPFPSFVIAVPSAIEVFNGTSTLYHWQVSFEAPMLYALGFIGLFTVGGLTGLFLASIPVDVHDTYLVVPHFHYIMVGGSASAFFGGPHFWWPKITGRMFSEAWARFAAILMFFGFNFTVFPQFIPGYLGMPWRHHVYPPEFQVCHEMSTVGATVLAAAYLLPPVYLGYSLLAGPAGRRQPVGRERPRMADHLPAPAAQRPARARAGPAGLRLPRGGPRAGPARPRNDRIGAPRARTSLADQRRNARFGMWVFIASEVLFFGALVMGYGFVRALHPQAFAESRARDEPVVRRARHRDPDRLVLHHGGGRTRRRRPRPPPHRVPLPRRPGGARGRVPGPQGLRVPRRPRPAPVAGQDFRLKEPAAQIFWSFYWAVTAVHALHLLIGIGLVDRLAWLLGAGASPRAALRSRSCRSPGASSASSGSWCFP